LQTAQEAEACRIATEEWQRKLAQSNREAAEYAERSVRDQQTRYAANAKAKRVIDIFVETVQNKRPSRETDGIGEYLDQMITAGIDLMAKYFEDQFRDYYDARKDI
jgi:membrane-bound ClpP family serine protease